MITKKIKIKGDITLTPLIDVVFILLIFFMVTMSLFNVRTIKINSPKTTNAINQNGNNDVKVFIINKNYILIDKLKLNNALQANKYINNYIAKNNNKKIIWGIKPDKTVDVERYLSVWKKLSDDGHSINIVTPKRGNIK